MKIQFKKKFSGADQQYVVDFLASELELSKMKVKKTIELGGLWIKKNGKSKKQRVKKIKTFLSAGDFIEFYRDEALTFVPPEMAQEVYKGSGFGLWYKPASMLSDGSVYSDQGALSYSVKKKYSNCHLIQRLDREVAGLMLVAYNKNMARYFSQQLQKAKIGKFYQAIVIGEMLESGKIDLDLDGKEAHTIYELDHTAEGLSYLNIELITGRFHQIRRHLDEIEHPVLGDPKYGEGNKNKDGLKLVSVKSSFIHPQTREQVEIVLPPELRLF